MTELYKTHRPKRLADMIGQQAVVKALEAKLKEGFPHVLLISGPSGCGKTTIARIIRRELSCSKFDYREINCAAVAMEAVRDIQRTMHLAPQNGPCRVWTLDEVQALSRAGFAQQAMLKMLEDTPEHVYFILCTTDPDKLIRTILTRCVKMQLSPLSPDEMGQLLLRVTVEEKIKLSSEIRSRIIDSAGGSARDALQLLQAVAGLENEQDRLEVLGERNVKKDAFELVRILLWDKGTWKDACKVIEAVDLSDPEPFRRLVLACAEKEALKPNGRADLACLVIELFREPFFNSGRAGILWACHEILRQKKS